MKKIILFTFLFSWLGAFAQDIKEGTIYYKDNREEKGFIRFGEKTNIWFKKNKDSVEVIHNYNDIYKFNTISDNGSIRNYHYELVPGESSTKVIVVDEDLDKGEVFFKDKTQKKGFIKIEKNSVLFKDNKDSEEEKHYDFNSIYKVSVNNDKGEVDNYEYKLYVKDYKTKVYLALIKVKGKVSYYHKIYDTVSSWYSNPTTGNSNPTIGFDSGFGEHTPRPSFFLSKENDLYLTLIPLHNTKNGQFRKNVAPLFFSDCPDLMDKIKKKQFEKLDFEGIVNYYNTKCTN